MLDVPVGEVSEPASLVEIPLAADSAADGWGVLVVPYRQLAERGFTAPDDGTPLLAMTICGQDKVPLTGALARLPDTSATLVGGHFDVDDAAYTEVVRRIVDDEIGTGEGANFVIKRTFLADIGDWSPRVALSFSAGCCSANSGPTGPSSSTPAGRGWSTRPPSGTSRSVTGPP
jgi:2-amino-4-deoxychorismate synthase